MAGPQFANTVLIPVEELPEGQVSEIRNSIVETLKALAAKEMGLTPDDLVCRDLRFVEDLQAYSVGTTAATVNNWYFGTAATVTTGFVTITGDKTMADQRYVAIYGVKDLRRSWGINQAAAATLSITSQCQTVGPVKIAVGGGDRAIWDLNKLQCYQYNMAGVTTCPILIPQNTAYNIYIYKIEATASVPAMVLFDGVVCEPRGKVLSP